MFSPHKAARFGVVAIALVPFSCIYLFQNMIESQSEKAIEFFSRYTVSVKRVQSNFSKPLSLCENEVFAETNFSFVSMLSGNMKLYAISAIKLGVSIRRWSNQDMIMMEIRERPLSSEIRSHLQAVGWKICVVPAIASPPTTDTNPYLDALMYSKLNAWGLDQYTAIVVIDSDMLVVGDPSPLFDHHLPHMLAENRTLGAARDSPRAPCAMVSWKAAPFNAGLLLIQPAAATLRRLRRAVQLVPHDLASAEQAPAAPRRPPPPPPPAHRRMLSHKFPSLPLVPAARLFPLPPPALR